MPFSKTILNGSELGKLTLPIWEDTEGLYITILVEFTVIAPLQLSCNIGTDRVPGFVPESGVVTCIVIGVSESEIEVCPIRFVLNLMLDQLKRCRRVQEAIEADKIAKPENMLGKRGLKCGAWNGTYVANVLSITTYMPRLWISSIAERHRSMSAKCLSKVVRSRGEYPSEPQG